MEQVYLLPLIEPSGAFERPPPLLLGHCGKLIERCPAELCDTTRDSIIAESHPTIQLIVPIARLAHQDCVHQALIGSSRMGGVKHQQKGKVFHRGSFGFGV